ncbi:MAG: TrkA family potassium uptake protein [Spirochaetota bacterium]
MAKEKVFAVLGLGAFGVEVCRVIAEKGGKVIAVDNQPSLIDKVKDTVTQAMLLDSTDEEALTSAALDDVDVAVVAIGENIEASILTTALLKKIGIPYIFARATSDIHQQVLKQVGANEVVNIEIDEGNRIAQRLMASEILDTIPLSQTISIAELFIPDEFIGKSLRQLDLRNRFNINLVSIKRVIISVDEVGNPIKNEEIIFPKPSEILDKNDILIIVGKNVDIEALHQLS